MSVESVPPAQRRRGKPCKNERAIASLKAALLVRDHLADLEAIIEEYDRRRPDEVMLPGVPGRWRGKPGRRGRRRFYTTSDAVALLSRSPELRDIVDNTQAALAGPRHEDKCFDVVIHERKGRISVDITELDDDGHVVNAETFVRGAA